MTTNDQVTVDRLWTVKDVMHFCVASRAWVYLQAQSGRLPSLKVCGLLRFDPDAVRAFVKGDVQPKVLPLPSNRAR